MPNLKLPQGMDNKALLGELWLESWSQFVKGSWNVRKITTLKISTNFNYVYFFQLHFFKKIFCISVRESK